MAESVVSLTYGTALYEAAKDLGKEEEILIEIKQLALLVQAYEDFSEFLNSPAIMPKEKKEAVKKIMQPAFSQEMLNFVYVLIDKGRTSQIKKIAKRYIELYDKDRGIAEGKVFSVVKLTPDQIQKFETEMSRLLQRNIKLENRVDPSLIGGIKIQVGGKMIDQSYRGDLERLREELEKQYEGRFPDEFKTGRNQFCYKRTDKKLPQQV